MIESLIEPGLRSLVIAKPDRVELWDVKPSGLVQRGELQLWGTIAALEKVELRVSARLS